MVNNKKLNQNETGLASFLVTLIMMIVISLVVLGFAQLARREQRESLDNQLSAAAYYAAESGVNDAIQAIQSDTTFGGSKNQCGPITDGSAPHLSNNSVGNNSSYTCLLINNTPGQLLFQDVAQNASTVTQLQTNSAPGGLVITWKNVTGTTTSYGSCPASGTFPSSWPTGANCGAGILRIDLIPATALGNSGDLQDFTYTAFLFPRNGGSGSLNLPAQIIASSPTKIPTTSNGVISTGKCLPASGSCSLTITNINTGPAPAGTIWYLRMTSIYNDSNVTIAAKNSGVTFQKGQIDIDSTGKANDVLKRILVAVPYGGTADDTPFALQTTDSLCKHFYITSSGAQPTYSAPNVGNFDDSSCYGK